MSHDEKKQYEALMVQVQNHLDELEKEYERQSEISITQFFKDQILQKSSKHKEYLEYDLQLIELLKNSIKHSNFQKPLSSHQLKLITELEIKENKSLCAQLLDKQFIDNKAIKRQSENFKFAQACAAWGALLIPAAPVISSAFCLLAILKSMQTAMLLTSAMLFGTWAAVTAITGGVGAVLLIGGLSYMAYQVYKNYQSKTQIEINQVIKNSTNPDKSLNEDEIRPKRNSEKPEARHDENELDDKGIICEGIQNKK